MTTFTELLGDQLLEQTTTDGVQTTNYIATSTLEGKTIGLLFSARWCGPCVQFAPQLAEIYNNISNEVGYKFEIVFISADHDQGSFDNFYNVMPWKALPFTDRTRQAALSNRYNVRGIPCLVVLSPSGEVLTRDGRQEIQNNGANCIRQWSKASTLEKTVSASTSEKIVSIPATSFQTYVHREQHVTSKTVMFEDQTMTTTTVFSELLGDRLLEHTTDGGAQAISYMATSKLDGKVIGLYFSGHWCPPSRGFTPQLAEAYKNAYNEVEHKFEIVFISWDKDQASFDSYYNEMPWKALPFPDRTRQEVLTRKYNVTGIPCLIVLSPTGEIITTVGVQEIYSSRADAIRKWSKASNLKKTVPAPIPVPVPVPVPIARTEAHKQEDKEITVKTVVVDDDDIPLVTRNKKVSRKRGCQFYLIIMGVGCLALLLLGLLIFFVVWKLLPKVQKPIITIEKKEDIQEISLKAMFSTSYILEEKNQWRNIKNIEDITDQLNRKLSGNKIRIVKVLFFNNSISEKYRRMMCNNPLIGNILQLYIIASSSDQCAYDDEICKFRLKEQLKNNLTALFNDEINIQFADDQFISTNVKLCTLTDAIEADEEEEEEIEITTTTTAKTMVSTKTTTTVFRSIPPVRQSLVTRNPICSVSPAKIISVIIAGQQGTEIRDETPTNGAINDYRNRNYITVTLYESSVNVLRIQLDCPQQYRDDSLDYSCANAYNIDAWIDLNDDGQFSEAENRIYRRSLINNQEPRGTYGLEICIPQIDGTKIKAGPHRMRLSLVPSKVYRRKCGKIDYSDTREYTVNIIPKAICEAADIIRTIIPKTFTCSPNTGRITRIVIGGERGTYIQDETQRNGALSEYENQQRLAVTLFGDALYLLHIQLDCFRQYGTDSHEIDCNRAHHVDVWIDLNNDGRFDESENRVYRRSSVDIEAPEYTYNFQIFVPLSDGITTNGGQHRMRIKLTRSEDYQRQCGNTDYSEIREYTVNIIPRKRCEEREYVHTPEPQIEYMRAPEPQREYVYASEPEPEPEPDVIVHLLADFTKLTHCSPGNFICSVGSGAISSVKLAGEQNTMLHDDIRRCSSTNNYEDRSHLVVKLFDNTNYMLRIQLYCVESSDYGNSYRQNPYSVNTNCNVPHYIDAWIDLNNDGHFDESRERFIQNDQYNVGYIDREYDLSFAISQIDAENYRDGPHRMRLVMTTEENNRKPCYSTGHGEVRDYTIDIVRRQYY